MHRHDLELIAALADGSLEDETLARQRVETCDECRAEFEAHASVLNALAGVAPAAMTDHEKAALHRDLWTELRTGDAAERSTSTPWWYRWSYAAAGLFVVVGLVAVLSQVNGGGNDGGIEAVSADTTSAASDGGAIVQGADEPPAAFDDTSGETDQSITEEGAADSFNFSELTEELKALRFTGRALTVEEETQYDDCLTEAGLDNHQVTETYVVDDVEYLAVVSKDAPVDEADDITYVDAATCLVVNQDG